MINETIGKNTTKNIAPIFFEQIQKLNRQARNINLVSKAGDYYPANVMSTQRNRIRVTAQEIIDSVGAE